MEASAPSAPGIPPLTTGTVLRPVVFVVDATPPAPGQHRPRGDEGDEPFDVRRTSLASSELTDAEASGGKEHVYETFLAALRGNPPGSAVPNALDEELSMAGSFASESLPPPTPRSAEEGEDVPSPPPRRFASPFARFSPGLGGRWKRAAHSPVGATEQGLDEGRHGGNGAPTSPHHALAQDMEDDDDHSPSGTSDHASAALTSYSRDNPPVHFASKRARIVSVSRRHAFPPSKFPHGKMDAGSTAMRGESLSAHNGNSWMSSYDIQTEGILPSGWIEKHARALPAAVVVVAKLNLTTEEARRAGMQNAKRAVDDLRMTLAEKRSVPIHVVCLLKEDASASSAPAGEDTKGGSRGSSASGDRRTRSAAKERMCQECRLPQSQVFLLQYPTDLEPDAFEAGILQSPYLATHAQQPKVATPEELASKVLMNPLLRRLDRSLRDESALYYARLAEAQERKLTLWRTRYHGTNASFEVNALMAALRCARYAAKAGTLREFQARTGSGGGRWTDGTSSAMRHYEEAYRWVMELHRRALAWRAAATSASAPSSTGSAPASGMMSPAPPTPGAKGLYHVDDIASPRFSESPGGGIGMELSLPGGANPPGPPPSAGAAATPPPPPARRNSPALTSRKGYDAPANVAFFALLGEQCRAVASVLNAKLLRATHATGASPGTEAEAQWRRHRATFLAVPRDIPFDPTENDAFFGPAWHRLLYATEERLTYACVAEGRWRRRCFSAAARSSDRAAPTPLGPSFHPPAAPWTAYGELGDAMLRLRRAVRRQMEEDDPSAGWLRGSTSQRRYVGSIVGGETGTLAWKFEVEKGRDHRAVALDYVLHALDLLDENTSLCNGGGSDSATTGEGPVQQPNSSARLHYQAARLLMGLDDPSGALVHLKIAADQTKSWPSLHLSIQRACFACEERCAATNLGEGAQPPDAIKSRESRIELLMRPESCTLLSPEEMANAQAKAWEEGSPREVVWNHDVSSRTKPPFEFAVSFLKSTHATSGDTVSASLSLKSCLNFEVCVEAIQLVTTSGTFDVPNIEQCMDSKMGGSVSSSKSKPSEGISFNSNDLAFFSTEITLPSALADIPLGGSTVDTSKFVPKNAKLTNMGLTHAAGSVSETRYDTIGTEQKISINGKPITTSSVSEPSASFLGGIPVACHGVVLILKRADGNGSSSLKLHIESPRLISPLLRSGAPRLAMEESNYTAHSWSRPVHHPWRLGPRVLRVLGPRPHMHVSNLTESQTDGKAIEGTVNRIILRIEAGSDEDCRDVRVRLKCSSTKKTLPNASVEDVATEGEPPEPNLMPVFVQKSADPAAKVVTENGVALPIGWEQRTDVDTEESHDATTTICPFLAAGNSFLFPLDLFRPLPVRGAGDCSTSYEVIIMYRQVRASKGATQSDRPGDEVMVVQSGSIEWVPPLVAEFSQSNGPKKPYPCGIQHVSNMTTQGTPDQSSSGAADLIAADGEKVLMRCSLEAMGLGSNVAASTILSVTNENEADEKKKILFSSGSGSFFSQPKRGLKLSLSYTVAAQRDVERGNGDEAMPLGVLGVQWKPVSLPLPDLMESDASAIADDLGHGPLSLPNLSPMIFYGPQCEVLSAPFRAKLLKCPSTPTVGTPFCISYQVANQTAKTQTLHVSLKDGQEEGQTGVPSYTQLFSAGKFKEETQMAPFEEKTFSFTFISMVAGNVCRPPLMISSGRHQTWVINESCLRSRDLFVMP